MPQHFLRSLTRGWAAGFTAGAIFSALTASQAVATGAPFPWMDRAAPAIDGRTLQDRISPPSGFKRIPQGDESFGSWLRNLPMKPAGAPVLLYTGAKKARQDVHAAVIDIDVGKQDLQQCADAIMRLRGEWLFASGRKREIKFNYTDGRPRRFSAYKRKTYKNFRKYMRLVFAYAGTYSLERELKPAKLEDIRIGDVFIKGGFPGHAVLVADMAAHPATGEKRYLLLQSYMPAQEMHILKNPDTADGSPWYAIPKGLMLRTPEWNFPVTALKRWP